MEVKQATETRRGQKTRRRLSLAGAEMGAYAASAVMQSMFSTKREVAIKVTVHLQSFYAGNNHASLSQGVVDISRGFIEYRTKCVITVRKHYSKLEQRLVNCKIASRRAAKKYQLKGLEG